MRDAQSHHQERGRMWAFREFLADCIGEETGTAPEQIATDKTFFEIGVTSVGLVRMLRSIGDTFGLDVDASVPFDYRTISALSEFLVTLEEDQQRHAF